MKRTYAQYLKGFFTVSIVRSYTTEDQGRETSGGNIEISSRGFFILVNSLDCISIPMKCAIQFFLHRLNFQFLSKSTIISITICVLITKTMATINLLIRKFAQQLYCHYCWPPHFFFYAGYFQDVQLFREFACVWRRMLQHCHGAWKCHGNRTDLFVSNVSWRLNSAYRP